MGEWRVPFVLAIDAEPDEPEFEPGSHAPWRGLEATFGLLDQLREILGRDDDPHFTWFLRMDPQVAEGYGSPAWAAETYGQQLFAVRAAGDEIGLHPHGWRWDGERHQWLSDLGDEAWLEHCVELSFDTYKQAFGEPCRAHRAGDRFMSNALLRMLRERGAEVDMTPEPGLRGVPLAPDRPFTAAIPDMDDVPRKPYLPSSSCWRQPAVARPGTDELLVIPLASADLGPLLGGWRAAARRVRNIGRPLHRPLLPWAADIGPRIWDVIWSDVQAGELTALAFAMRSHAAIDPIARASLLDSVAVLARHELRESLDFVTASEARTHLLARPEIIGIARMTQPGLRASVIVPTYRRPEQLRRCLDGIVRQTRAADEVIVVVRSTDRETLDALGERHRNVDVGGAPIVAEVVEPGVIAALQVGFQRSSGDVIVLTDDDAVPRPDWLATLLSHYADARVACVGGRDIQVDSEVPADEVGVIQPWGRLVGEHHRGSGGPRPVDHLRGVNMSVRRRWWRLDPRLRGTGAQYAWELDACLAARRADRLVIYDPAALVDHEHGPRFDADQRDGPDFAARAERVHNETYMLLKWLDPWRALTVFGYGLLVGTRFAPGPILVVERLLAGDNDALSRAAAGLVGRCAALFTLAAAARDRDWRRETHR